MPPNMPLCITARNRICVPFPHMTVHGVHSVNLETKQSVEHGHVWQGWLSRKALHARPPAAGTDTTLRVRDRMPVPHFREHSLQGLKMDIAQSTGHCVV